MPVTSQIIKPTFSTSYQRGSTSQWQLLSFFLAFTSPSPPPALSNYLLLIYQKWWSDCRVVLHRFPPLLHYMYTKHLLHHTGCFLWCPSFSPWLSTETMTHMLTCILGVVKYWCQTCCSCGFGDNIMMFCFFFGNGKEGPNYESTYNCCLGPLGFIFKCFVYAWVA